MSDDNSVKLSFDGKECIIALDKWIDKFKVDADAFMRAFATNLMGNIVRLTPVDTGNARGNWRPSLNSEDLSYEPGNDADPSAEVAKIYSAGSMATIFWLCNSTPYISALENGHSGQAPQGMVALTFADAERFYTHAFQTVFKGTGEL